MTAGLFFVVNPRAGSGRARRVWSRLVSDLQRTRLPFEYELTQGSETATSFVRQALRRGARTIVAVGGDGTVHEAANGFFLGTEPISPEASLGIVPCGSTNDYARGVGLPIGGDALHTVLHGRTVRVDVGRARFMDEAGRQMTRHFVNGADLGVGVRTALGGAALRTPGGRLRQALTTLVVLPAPQPWRGRIMIDDEPAEEVEATSAVVGVGPFAGGGVELLPGAKVDDGRFDVLVVKPMGTAELLGLIPSVAAGTHLAHRALRHAFAQRVTVETTDWPFLELDGEAVGAGAVTFELLPGALRVHVPIGGAS